MNAPLRSIGSHQSASMKSDVWLTPPRIIKALGPFDLDPCAAPEPRPWPTASRHISLPENGLLADWGGSEVMVWCNPPYSKEAVRWLRRMADHGNGIALVFARTETSWFWETVWNAETATAALFLKDRLYFHVAEDTRFPRKDGPPIFVPAGGSSPANSGAPSVLVAYGREAAGRLLTSGLAGGFVMIGRAAA